MLVKTAVTLVHGRCYNYIAPYSFGFVLDVTADAELIRPDTAQYDSPLSL
jgi:hypothetical protein